MGSKRRVRHSSHDDPVVPSTGRAGRHGSYDEPMAPSTGRASRLEEKRQRFVEEDRRGPRPLSPTLYVTIGGIVLAVIFVVLMTFRTGGASTASAEVLQQVQGSTGFTEGGRVGISVQEVQQKKLVYWDYKKGNKTTPLIAYVTPSGAVKVAIRMCEPCNGYSFRVEGNQIVCNTCGTRWDLETSKGISGGCQSYPPEVLSSTIADGKISVDEGKVSNWTPRV